MKAVTIFGVGLMGGSFALALKAALPGIRTVGVDRAEVLKRAHELNIVDRGDPQDSDLFVLATPVGEILRLIDECAPGDRLITDLGSTKSSICQRAEQRGLNFVGGHPMTGSERAGPDAATSDLFRGTRYFLCPVSSTAPGGMEMMQDVVRAIGATPELMRAEEHDRLVAQVSHLPQLLSTLLADYTANNRQFSGPGLKSMIRLAGSPYHVWRDILETSEFLPHELRGFIEKLNAALESIDSGNFENIRAAFDRTDGANNSS